MLGVWVRAVVSEEIVEVFDALDADLKRLCDLSFEVFTTARCVSNPRRFC